MLKDINWNVDEINFKDYDLPQPQLLLLPDCPICPVLVKLYMQVPGLTEIPETFFEHMPMLEVLDLSNTKIVSLPTSIVNLSLLQEFFLRDCSYLVQLPTHVGMLSKLKLFDIKGTELMYIPKEMGKLKELEVLRISLSQYARYYIKSNRVSETIIPRDMIPELKQLKELCITISVGSEPQWWEEEVKYLQNELCALENLKTLTWYLPTSELLQQFLLLERNHVPIYTDLSNLMLTIGQHAQLTSCLPHGLEKKFEELENCLKWINAEGSTGLISKIMTTSKALFLSRHWTIKKLSIVNITKLKYCLLVECNEMETVVEVDNVNNKVGLDMLQYLSIHHMNKLQSIWKGPISKDSLSKLRILALHTCPLLTSVFTLNIAQNLLCLTELNVENCPKVKRLISTETETNNMIFVSIFPRLEKIFLLGLPELEKILGCRTTLNKLSTLLIYNCLKLRSLDIEELPNLTKIEGDIVWWNKLDCDTSVWKNIFSPLGKGKALFERLFETRNSLLHFLTSVSHENNEKKLFDSTDIREQMITNDAPTEKGRGIFFRLEEHEDDESYSWSRSKTPDRETDMDNFNSFSELDTGPLSGQEIEDNESYFSCHSEASNNETEINDFEEVDRLSLSVQEPSSSSSIQKSCYHFDFSEIQVATEYFDESLVIGRGGFGKVYKGKVIIGSSLVVAAIKRLDSMSNQGATEFWAEVEMLSMLRHCNLVSLIGYCNYEREMILVYEYISNGTLEGHLHKFGTRLSWIQRLNICIGAGRALNYLHTGTGIQSGVIHRDVKSSNILLDEGWAAKISDFGLSRIRPTNHSTTYVNTRIKGSFGYFDPNYFMTGKLTRKSDVYAFGVVLLEVLCRKRAVDISLDEDQWGLVAWVQDYIKEGNLKNIVDSNIRIEISPKCLEEFVRITERCLHKSPKQRPTMAEVLFGLESVLALQEKFNKSLQSAGRTVIGRMFNLFPFSTKTEHSVQGKSKSPNNIKGNNTFPEMKTEVPAHFQGRSLILKEFRFEDLEKATRKFSQDMLIGQGGFGKVFLGWIDHNTLAPSKQGMGVAIAVKRFNREGTQGYAQWQAEVNFLGQLDHPNIIRLLGYSYEHEHLLVYEYMPNKSFDHFLFSDIAEQLSWGKRLMIMIGIVRAMTYLHSKNIISRGLKSADILLDEDFNAKLGDFGLVRYGPQAGQTHVSTMVMGTFGYIAPEYIATGRLTSKSDIYCLGVVLLESLTGRKALDIRKPDGEHSLVKLATGIRKSRRNLKKIMDPRLKNNYPLQGASECFALALRCVAKNPKDRPSSEEVLQSLEQIYARNQ